MNNLYLIYSIEYNKKAFIEKGTALHHWMFIL